MRPARMRETVGMMKNDSLQKAIAYLDAVEVAPRKWAIQVDRGDGVKERWVIVGRNTLETMRRYGFNTTRTGVLMPSWWTPESRFAWRVEMPSGKFYIEHNKPPKDAQYGKLRPPYIICVTADLETGEEVPA